MSTQTTYHVGRCHLGHGVSEEGVLLPWGATVLQMSIAISSTKKKDELGQGMS